MGIAFMTYHFADLPDAAYRAPFDVSSLPPWTLVSVFAAVSLTAGVVEFVWQGWLSLLAGAAAIPVFRRLASVPARGRTETSAGSLK